MIPDPYSTPYEYIGDVPALGNLQLTQLAKSFEELESTPLDFLFPSEVINERQVVIERVTQGLGIMPIVRAGIPSPTTLDPDRVERKSYSPIYLRENDFLDQTLINQLRQVGTTNTQYAPQRIIEDRIRKLINRRNRTLDFFRVQCLLGGITYNDPRSDVSVDVSTGIPANNFFRYDGFNATVASGSVAGLGFVANKNLTNNKGRTEALLFSDAGGKCAVPWSSQGADIVRCLRLIKQYLANTNKNMFTDIVMSRDLYTVIQENSFIKAYMGAVGVFTSTNGNGIATSTTSGPPVVQFGPGGDIMSIAGLNIILVDQLYSAPDGSGVTKMWPSNKVALVARNHFQDRSATLGRTQFCVGEAPDGTAGMWMRTGPDQMPPAVPGRTMQMGDSFLPYAVYPQWISILEVCDSTDIDTSLVLRGDLGFGTF